MAAVNPATGGHENAPTHPHRRSTGGAPKLGCAASDLAVEVLTAYLNPVVELSTLRASLTSRNFPLVAARASPAISPYAP